MAVLPGKQDSQVCNHICVFLGIQAQFAESGLYKHCAEHAQQVFCKTSYHFGNCCCNKGICCHYITGIKCIRNVHKFKILMLKNNDPGVAAFAALNCLWRLYRLIAHAMHATCRQEAIGIC